MFNPTREELAAAECSDYRSNLDGHIMGYDILKLPIVEQGDKNEEICIIGFHMEHHSDAIGLIKDQITESFDYV